MVRRASVGGCGRLPVPKAVIFDILLHLAYLVGLSIFKQMGTGPVGVTGEAHLFFHVALDVARVVPSRVELVIAWFPHYL